MYQLIKQVEQYYQTIIDFLSQKQIWNLFYIKELTTYNLQDSSTQTFEIDIALEAKDDVKMFKLLAHKFTFKINKKMLNNQTPQQNKAFLEQLEKFYHRILISILIVRSKYKTLLKLLKGHKPFLQYKIEPTLKNFLLGMIDLTQTLQNDEDDMNDEMFSDYADEYDEEEDGDDDGNYFS